MKKLSTLLCLAALPVAASAQVELIAGWNFGQFISSMVPSTDGTTGDAVGFIPSNFTGNSRPGPGTSGPEHISAGDSSTFSLGSGVINWNGVNGSDVWSYADATGVFVNNQPETYSSINGSLVNGNDLAAGQQDNWQLQFNKIGAVQDFAITVNTLGFADFNSASFSQPNDSNFTFAAFGSGSLTFFHEGSQIGGSIAITSNEVAYQVDLPAAFYGKALSTLIVRVSGTVNLDNVQVNGVSAVPEPSTYGALAGLAVLSAVAARRRRR